MLLGLYEQEILASIIDVPSKYNTFIDLGAADGYYGIGALISNRYETSYCFEMTELGRSLISKNATLNCVADRLFIHGIATKEFYKGFTAEQLSKSVILIDIEGAEFALIDEELLVSLKDSIIIIELHEWHVEDGDRKLEELRHNASRLFDVTRLTTTARDLSKFPELKYLNDTDRWLICSEGRGRLQTWYRLDPRRNSLDAPA
jgi:hypothetical protein